MLIMKEGGQKFCLADFVCLIQKPSRRNYDSWVFQAKMKVTAHFLNQINTIREKKL